MSVHGDADGGVDGPVGHLAVSHIHVDRVDEHRRMDDVEWAASGSTRIVDQVVDLAGRGRRAARMSRRVIVVVMSGQGQTVPDITSLPQVSEDYVRDVIHAFTERGFDALDPQWRRGDIAASRKGCGRLITATTGVMHMPAALNLATGKLFYRILDLLTVKE